MRRDEEQLQPYSDAVLARFFRRVAKDGDGGCWNWIGPDNGHGYCRFHDGERNRYAHRFSFVIHHGPITDGLQVCHRCDNRRCVNPDHLWLGTQADNIHDAMRKNRLVNPPVTQWKERVTPHHWEKLTVEQVIEIKRALAAGEKLRVVAEQFGVGQKAIEKIKYGQRWTHVNP